MWPSFIMPKSYAFDSDEATASEPEITAEHPGATK